MRTCCRIDRHLWQMTARDWLAHDLRAFMASIMLVNNNDVSLRWTRSRLNGLSEHFRPFGYLWGAT